MKRNLSKLSIVILAAMIIGLVLPALPAHSAPQGQIQGAGAPWLDPEWHYRRPVTISNPCGSVQADYQVQITLDNTFDYANALADGSDIRVTSDDGTTLFPAWVESWNPPTSASIWVKVPSLPVAGVDVYLYYGNSSPVVQQVEVPPSGPWIKPTGNPIVPIGDPSAGANLLAENMVYDPVTAHYWLVFSNYRTSPSSIGLAWSDDPGNPAAWNWHSGSVVTSAISPHILFYNGTWYIFYSDRAVASPYPIVVVSSSSITGPYTNKQTILTAGAAGSWEDFRVDEPYVLQRPDGKWVLTYMGDAGSNVEQVGVATADNLLGPYAKAAGNPVIAFSAGYYDAGTVADPWVVNFNNTYYIGYTVSTTTASPWQTAYATTTDWVTFTKRGMTLPLGAPGSWDALDAFRGAVTRFGDTYYFPYTGYVGGYRMGIATQSAYKAINNPDLVFEVYDGFDGTTLSTKWNYRFTSGSGHTITVAGGLLTLRAVPSGYLEMWASPLLGGETIIEVYGQHLDAGINNGSETRAVMEVGYKNYPTFSEPLFLNMIRLMDYPHLTRWTQQSQRPGFTSGYVTSAFSFNTNWHTFRVARLPSGQAGFQVDNNAWETISSTSVPTVVLQPWLMDYATTPATQSRFIVDWARARKYCGTEATAAVSSLVEQQDTLPVTGTGPVVFGSGLDVTIDVTQLGDLTCLQVIHFPYDHPDATDPLKTGQYWEVNPCGTSGYIVSLTLPHNTPVDANDKVCRWTGGGGLWDCAMTSIDTGNNTITRAGITQLSDWATGNDAGPTVVGLERLDGRAKTGSGWWLLALLGLASGGVLLWLSRRMVGRI